MVPKSSALEAIRSNGLAISRILTTTFALSPFCVSYQFSTCVGTPHCCTLVSSLYFQPCRNEKFFIRWNLLFTSLRGSVGDLPSAIANSYQRVAEVELKIPILRHPLMNPSFHPSSQRICNFKAKTCLLP